ncbi:MAG: lytic transglycosylase domain-containing protein [Deferribacteres bacterium]|nr:lytic transglycosylase domain-containing protein [Deferribacteres bacterium]
MTFRNLMLSVLLTLFLSANLSAEIICESQKGVIFCYNRPEKAKSTTADGRKAYIESLIKDTARKYGVDPELALKVAKIESNLNQQAVSPKGAIGVMQLMPETARELGVNPYNLEENIKGGIAYLKYLIEKYNGDIDLALAAYNAGPSAVDRYGDIPPYKETINYVRKIRGSVPAYRGSRIRKVKLPDGTILYTNLPYTGATR